MDMTWGNQLTYFRHFDLLFFYKNYFGERFGFKTHTLGCSSSSTLPKTKKDIAFLYS